MHIESPQITLQNFVPLVINYRKRDVGLIGSLFQGQSEMLAKCKRRQEHGDAVPSHTLLTKFQKINTQNIRSNMQNISRKMLIYVNIKGHQFFRYSRGTHKKSVRLLFEKLCFALCPY